MPQYDYRCRACRHEFTVEHGSIAEVDDTDARCPRCDASSPIRLIRRIAVLTSEDSRIERLTDPARLAALESDDPKALGGLMREMAGELGEDAGPEIGEAIERLESGESPDSVERSLGLDGPADLP